MNKRSSACLVSLLLALAGCVDMYDPTPRPDYAIRVVPAQQGRPAVAVPPECPSWQTAVADPFDNQPIPQFGCANARNLAAMIERPEDVVQGRKLADERGVAAVGAVRRYDRNQSRGLIVPGNEPNQIAVTTSTAASTLDGDVTNGGSSSSTTTSGAP